MILTFELASRLLPSVASDVISCCFMQGISCVDVADICVKALHDLTARNKSFDVGFNSFIFL